MMNIKSFLKYFLRFVSLQATLTVLMIYYFDNYLISNTEFKELIYLNLVEDVERFLPFFDVVIISVDLSFNNDVYFFNNSLFNKILYICK